MKKYFITYCDKKYESNRKNLVSIANNCFDNIISYTPNDIEEEFYKKNEHILVQKRGIGYWLWKPYIINKTLNLMEENDILFYLDSGDHFEPEIARYIEERTKQHDIILVPSTNMQKQYTKRDCFYYMDCDSKEYWDATQIEAGIIIIKKTNNSLKIMQEWLKYCQNENILTDLSNICDLENDKHFQDHRHDQSVLSNLAVKYNILLDNAIRYYARCNVI